MMECILSHGEHKQPNPSVSQSQRDEAYVLCNITLLLGYFANCFPCEACAKASSHAILPETDSIKEVIFGIYTSRQDAKEVRMKVKKSNCSGGSSLPDCHLNSR